MHEGNVLAKGKNGGDTMKIIYGIMLVILTFTSVSVAEGEHFIVTEIGTSARMIGYGNVEGFSKNSESVFENPAALYSIDNLSGSLFTTKLINELEYQNFSIGAKTDFGIFAFGYMGLSVKEIPHTYQKQFNNDWEIELIVISILEAI